MLARFGSVLAWLEVQRNRATLYRLASIVGPLLIAAGLLTSGQAGVVLAALGALAGAGGNRLAVRHSRAARPAHGARGAVDVLLLIAVATLLFVLLLFFGVHGHR